MKKLKFSDFKNDLSVAAHFIKLAHSISRSYIPLVVISSMFKAVSPFLNIIMPKFIIDELLGEQNISLIAIYVGVVVAGNALLNLINKFFNMKIDIANASLVNGFELNLGEHIMEMSYESLEDPEVLNKKEQALYPIRSQGAIWRMINDMIGLLQTAITIIGLVAIVSTLNIVLILLIIVVTIVNSAVYKKSQSIQFKLNQELTPINRRFMYYMQTTTDFSIGKDMRIFNMSPLMLDKSNDNNSESLSFYEKLLIIEGKFMGLSNINLQVQMLVVYGYMVWRVLAGAISIGDFSMYISAANNFSSSISSFMTQFIEFRQMCKYLDLYVHFEAIGDKVVDGTKKVDLTKKSTIEFKNVYFKYPRSEDYILKDVSIKITSGEKLSIVGQNGAGKTTFIKLLCRLYAPEKGEILLNGIPSTEYSFNEYTKLLSVVFQDFKLFSFSIKQNMCFDANKKDTDIKTALEKSGIYDKIESLKNGMDTSLYKNFDPDGVELSGGEMQKLAIARAICKDTQLVILDEPTAALDPYAEAEIYTKFNELVDNRTAIYISHRLSSCRFCDKIAVFNNGTICEYGTHDELEKLDGKYTEMWQAQAQYYQ